MLEKPGVGEIFINLSSLLGVAVEVWGTAGADGVEEEVVSASFRSFWLPVESQGLSLVNFSFLFAFLEVAVSHFSEDSVWSATAHSSMRSSST